MKFNQDNLLKLGLGGLGGYFLADFLLPKKGYGFFVGDDCPEVPGSPWQMPNHTPKQCYHLGPDSVKKLACQSKCPGLENWALNTPEGQKGVPDYTAPPIVQGGESIVAGLQKASVPLPGIGDVPLWMLAAGALGLILVVKMR